MTGIVFGEADSSDQGTSGRGVVPFFHGNTMLAIIVLAALGFLWLVGKVFAGFNVPT